MAGFVELLTSWVKLLVPDPCFDEFFVNYNFFHAACLKTVISKCLGYGIILGSIMVKVPQIAKILSAKSAEGLSIVSSTLELTAITGVLAYSYANGFPFSFPSLVCFFLCVLDDLIQDNSAYGEAIFLAVQTVIIAFLVLTYTRGTTVGVIYTAVYGAILAYLLSPMAPRSLLWALQASVMFLVVMARMIQAVTNYRNQSTGQLSGLTVALLFFGSTGRIFTSYQETGDMIVILTYCVSTFCNAVLLFQLWYYRNSTGKELPHVHKKTK